MFLVRQAENITSRQGSFKKRSPVGSQFSEFSFPDVHGTATEQVRLCGFRRNSPRSKKAPKIRGSVRLTTLESFIVSLSSISAETWEMHSWAIPGSSVFCDWLFLEFSDVSLETAANFLSFLNVAMILKKNFCQLWKLHFFKICSKSVNLL